MDQLIFPGVHKLSAEDLHKCQLCSQCIVQFKICGLGLNKEY